MNASIKAWTFQKQISVFSLLKFILPLHLLSCVTLSGEIDVSQNPVEYRDSNCVVVSPSDSHSANHGVSLIQSRNGKIFHVTQDFVLVKKSYFSPDGKYLVAAASEAGSPFLDGKQYLAVIIDCANGSIVGVGLNKYTLRSVGVRWISSQLLEYEWWESNDRSKQATVQFPLPK